ncbi:MAG: cyclodeaminase/cyclohydrolase family protein [Oscillospiraceae bacterium]|jgi:formiminotetrahydrofolate cyclodeaminase|nr:cyclodeaminase/cyclohydrolase family protein [Oscillospiraceae bacterium]
MKLSDRTLEDFGNFLASDVPAPGGGAAAALAGSFGAALTHMVAALTAGKPRYAEHAALMRTLLSETERLRGALLTAVDRDVEAFRGMSVVFTMPKETEAEKEARRTAKQRALRDCTHPPYEMMNDILLALRLTEQALGRSNKSAVSDLGVAALLLKAALQGAWLNVLINIGSMDDAAFAESRRTAGAAILAEALPLADKIYGTVLAELAGESD